MKNKIKKNNNYFKYVGFFLSANSIALETFSLEEEDYTLRCLFFLYKKEKESR